MEHVFVDFEVPEPAVKDLKSLEGDCVEMERIVERDVLDFREIGENPLVEDNCLVVASTSWVVFAGKEESGYEIVMLVASFEVVDEEREGAWVLKGDFMGHEFVALGTVLIDFEEVAGVFEVEVLEWRFEDGDLLEEGLAVAHGGAEVIWKQTNLNCYLPFILFCSLIIHIDITN